MPNLTAGKNKNKLERVSLKSFFNLSIRPESIQVEHLIVTQPRV
jgi:hypothetical protein